MIFIILQDEVSTNYLLEYMYYEYDNGNNKKISSKQGTARNALRLCRALHFIEVIYIFNILYPSLILIIQHFLSKLNSVDQDLKSAAQESYATTLSNYHTWTVRKAVGLAFYTLPSRQKFLKDLELDVDVPNVFEPLVKVTKQIREIMNEFYTKYDLTSI